MAATTTTEQARTQRKGKSQMGVNQQTTTDQQVFDQNHLRALTEYFMYVFLDDSYQQFCQAVLGATATASIHDLRTAITEAEASKAFKLKPPSDALSLLKFLQNKFLVANLLDASVDDNEANPLADLQARVQAFHATLTAVFATKTERNNNTQIQLTTALERLADYQTTQTQKTLLALVQLCIANHIDDQKQTATHLPQLPTPVSAGNEATLAPLLAQIIGQQPSSILAAVTDIFKPELIKARLKASKETTELTGDALDLYRLVISTVINAIDTLRSQHDRKPLTQLPIDAPDVKNKLHNKYEGSEVAEVITAVEERLAEQNRLVDGAVEEYDENAEAERSKPSFERMAALAEAAARTDAAKNNYHVNAAPPPSLLQIADLDTSNDNLMLEGAQASQALATLRAAKEEHEKQKSLKALDLSKLDHNDTGQLVLTKEQAQLLLALDQRQQHIAAATVTLATAHLGAEVNKATTAIASDVAQLQAQLQGDPTERAAQREFAKFVDNLALNFPTMANPHLVATVDALLQQVIAVCRTQCPTQIEELQQQLVSFNIANAEALTAVPVIQPFLATLLKIINDIAQLTTAKQARLDQEAEKLAPEFDKLADAQTARTKLQAKMARLQGLLQVVEIIEAEDLASDVGATTTTTVSEAAAAGVGAPSDDGGPASVATVTVVATQATEALTAEDIASLQKFEANAYDQFDRINRFYQKAVQTYEANIHDMEAQLAVVHGNFEIITTPKDLNNLVIPQLSVTGLPQFWLENYARYIEQIALFQQQAQTVVAEIKKINPNCTHITFTIEQIESAINQLQQLANKNDYISGIHDVIFDELLGEEAKQKNTATSRGVRARINSTYIPQLTALRTAVAAQNTTLAQLYQLNDVLVGFLAQYRADLPGRAQQYAQTLATLQAPLGNQSATLAAAEAALQAHLADVQKPITKKTKTAKKKLQKLFNLVVDLMTISPLLDQTECVTVCNFLTTKIEAQLTTTDLPLQATNSATDAAEYTDAQPDALTTLTTLQDTIATQIEDVLAQATAMKSHMSQDGTYETLTQTHRLLQLACQCCGIVEVEMCLDQRDIRQTIGSQLLQLNQTMNALIAKNGGPRAFEVRDEVQAQLVIIQEAHTALAQENNRHTRAGQYYSERNTESSAAILAAETAMEAAYESALKLNDHKKMPGFIGRPFTQAVNLLKQCQKYDKAAAAHVAQGQDYLDQFTELTAQANAAVDALIAEVPDVNERQDLDTLITLYDEAKAAVDAALAMRANLAGDCQTANAAQATLKQAELGEQRQRKDQLLLPFVTAELTQAITTLNDDNPTPAQAQAIYQHAAAEVRLLTDPNTAVGAVDGHQQALYPKLQAAMLKTLENKSKAITEEDAPTVQNAARTAMSPLPEFSARNIRDAKALSRELARELEEAQQVKEAVCAEVDPDNKLDASFSSAQTAVEVSTLAVAEIDPHVAGLQQEARNELSSLRAKMIVKYNREKLITTRTIGSVRNSLENTAPMAIAAAVYSELQNNITPLMPEHYAKFLPVQTEQDSNEIASNTDVDELIERTYTHFERLIELTIALEADETVHWAGWALEIVKGLKALFDHESDPSSEPDDAVYRERVFPNNAKTAFDLEEYLEHFNSNLLNLKAITCHTPTRLRLPSSPQLAMLSRSGGTVYSSDDSAYSNRSAAAASESGTAGGGEGGAGSNSDDGSLDGDGVVKALIFDKPQTHTELTDQLLWTLPITRFLMAQWIEIQAVFAQYQEDDNHYAEFFTAVYKLLPLDTDTGSADAVHQQLFGCAVADAADKQACADDLLLFVNEMITMAAYFEQHEPNHAFLQRIKPFMPSNDGDNAVTTKTTEVYYDDDFSSIQQHYLLINVPRSLTVWNNKAYQTSVHALMTAVFDQSQQVLGNNTLASVLQGTFLKGLVNQAQTACAQLANDIKQEWATQKTTPANREARPSTLTNFINCFDNVLPIAADIMPNVLQTNFKQLLWLEIVASRNYKAETQFTDGIDLNIKSHKNTVESAITKVIKLLEALHIALGDCRNLTITDLLNADLHPTLELITQMAVKLVKIVELPEEGDDLYTSLDGRLANQRITNDSPAETLPAFYSTHLEKYVPTEIANEHHSVALIMNELRPQLIHRLSVAESSFLDDKQGDPHREELRDDILNMLPTCMHDHFKQTVKLNKNRIYSRGKLITYAKNYIIALEALCVVGEDGANHLDQEWVQAFLAKVQTAVNIDRNELTDELVSMDRYNPASDKVKFNAEKHAEYVATLKQQTEYVQPHSADADDDSADSTALLSNDAGEGGDITEFDEATPPPADPREAKRLLVTQLNYIRYEVLRAKKSAEVKTTECQSATKLYNDVLRKLILDTIATPLGLGTYFDETYPPLADTYDGGKNDRYKRFDKDVAEILGNELKKERRIKDKKNNPLHALNFVVKLIKLVSVIAANPNTHLAEVEDQSRKRLVLLLQQTLAGEDDKAPSEDAATTNGMNHYTKLNSITVERNSEPRVLAEWQTILDRSEVKAFLTQENQAPRARRALPGIPTVTARSTTTTAEAAREAAKAQTKANAQVVIKKLLYIVNKVHTYCAKKQGGESVDATKHFRTLISMLNKETPIKLANNEPMLPKSLLEVLVTEQITTNLVDREADIYANHLIPLIKLMKAIIATDQWQPGYGQLVTQYLAALGKRISHYDNSRSMSEWVDLIKADDASFNIGDNPNQVIADCLAQIGIAEASSVEYAVSDDGDDDSLLAETSLQPVPEEASVQAQYAIERLLTVVNTIREYVFQLKRNAGEASVHYHHNHFSKTFDEIQAVLNTHPSNSTLAAAIQTFKTAIDETQYKKTDTTEGGATYDVHGMSSDYDTAQQTALAPFINAIKLMSACASKIAEAGSTQNNALINEYAIATANIQPQQANRTGAAGITPLNQSATCFEIDELDAGQTIADCLAKIAQAQQPESAFSAAATSQMSTLAAALGSSMDNDVFGGGDNGEHDDEQQKQGAKPPVNQ